MIRGGAVTVCGLPAMHRSAPTRSGHPAGPMEGGGIVGLAASLAEWAVRRSATSRF